MIGELTHDQINLVLESEVIGRIGCLKDGKMYIVPINYVYDGNFIYGHSKEGLKINLMRENPNVCFEVDSIDTLASWRSVILWGQFEELKTPEEEQRGLKLLTDRLDPLVTGETLHQAAPSHPPLIVEKETKAIVYRIKVLEKTGRFEKP